MACQKKRSGRVFSNRRKPWANSVSQRTTGSADFVLLFNLLHAESPAVLLDEARRILRPGGRLAVTHWNPDPSTPRGPAMDIRPRPEDCRQWMHACGFHVDPSVIDPPPWHFGLTAVPA